MVGGSVLVSPDPDPDDAEVVVNGEVVVNMTVVVFGAAVVVVTTG